MKKQYQKPKTELFSFETQYFLAASANVEIVGGEFPGGFNSREFENDDLLPL
ncbi:MAG: hypothetical protein IJV17_03990 [Prevotella sp.]|nr:hypothetical protein [Prevotella sp.]